MRDLRAEVRRRLAPARLEPTREREIVDELVQHLEQRVADLVMLGSPPEAAADAALAELDDDERLSRELRTVEPSWRPPPVPGAPRRGLFADLGHDLRYGVRALRQNPAFTAVTVLSLALGIGANTALFQLLDSLHLQTLPLDAPQELAQVKFRERKNASGQFNSWHPDLTYAQLERIREEQQVFDGLAAWGDRTFNLTPGGEARYARGMMVTGDFFDVLRVRPHVGRLFTRADDDRAACSRSAVLSHAFWQREMGGDPGAVGRPIHVDGVRLEIAGVAEPGFFGLEVGRSFDVAVPMCVEAMINGDQSRLDRREAWWLSAVGRLRTGVTLTEASAAMEAISPRVMEPTVPTMYDAETAKTYRTYRLGAFPAATGISDLRRTYTTPLYFLLVTAGLVLLIACANLANLLLARASAREREIAVRLALGASRGRLIRQLMTESLLLALLGAALGLFLAHTLSEVMVSFLSTRDRPLFVALDPGWRVLGFNAGLAILTCTLFGLAPALRASRTEVGVVLTGAGGHQRTGSHERSRLRRTLVVTQIALSFVLLVGALLFSRTLSNLASQDPGFHVRDVVVLGVDLRPLHLPPGQQVGFKSRLLERARQVPGIAIAASTSIVPISGNGWNNQVWRDGGEPGDLVSDMSLVSDGYFKALGQALVAGRDFDRRDGAGAPKVTVINQTLAHKVFGDANPIGQRLRAAQGSTDNSVAFEVVGVVADSKYRELRASFGPIAYFPSEQDADPFPYDQLVIRLAAGVPANAVIDHLRAAMAEISPALVIDFDFLDRMLLDSLLRERLMATLSMFFGALAALLATIGLYGVISYSVARRTHEIGIRMALGASRQAISKLVLSDALRLVLIGLGVGAALAIAGSRLAAALLYGLAPHDPLTYVVAVVLLAGVALVATLLPARRAARVDPMVALREE